MILMSNEKTSRSSYDLSSVKPYLRQAANKLNVSMNAIVILAVREWLQKNGFLNS